MSEAARIGGSSREGDGRRRDRRWLVTGDVDPTMGWSGPEDGWVRGERGRSVGDAAGILAFPSQSSSRKPKWKARAWVVVHGAGPVCLALLCLQHVLGAGRGRELATPPKTATTGLALAASGRGSDGLHTGQRRTGSHVTPLFYWPFVLHVRKIYPPSGRPLKRHLSLC